MASAQERLQQKRVPLDKWTISEQLYLASAVSCSGDQNWMSVSRNLKMICGQDRPSDWFSQKSCAAQYERLLETCGTTKRKKRNERDSGPQVVETPIDMILRRLTQERMAELNKVTQDEKDEYNMIQAEIAGLDDMTEDQLREMCERMDAEEKQREKDQLKHNQWLKDREERNRKLETAARLGSTSTMPHATASTSQAIKIEELDIIDDSHTKQATSPLLTSLLKSPSAAPNPSTSLLNTMPNQSRVTAPTITNLLTTGSVPNITVSGLPQPSTSAGIAYGAQIQHQPLSGPVSNDSFSGNLTPTPSQAAPTLSMLLENKHKDNKLATQTSLDGGASTSMAIKNEQNVGLVAGDMNNPDLTINEEQQLMDALNDLIPADMDVLAGIILDDLINEEQAAAVSSVAEALEMDAMAGVAPATAEPEPIPSTSAAAVAAELAGGKAEPNNISDNACDGMDFETTADEFLEMHNKTDASNTGGKQLASKDEDSSDLSNDTPLSELIKQEATSKQRKLEEQQLQQQEQQEQQQSDELLLQLQLEQTQNEEQQQMEQKQQELDSQTEHFEEEKQMQPEQPKQQQQLEQDNKEPQQQQQQPELEQPKTPQEQKADESTHSAEIETSEMEKSQEQPVEQQQLSEQQEEPTDEELSDLVDPLATSNESVDVEPSVTDKSTGSSEEGKNSDESRAIESTADELEDTEAEETASSPAYADEFLPVEAIANADENQSGDDENVHTEETEQATDPLEFDVSNVEHDEKHDEAEVNSAKEDDEKDEQMEVENDGESMHDTEEQNNATADETQNDVPNNDGEDIVKSGEEVITDDAGAKSENTKSDDDKEDEADDDDDIEDDEQKQAGNDQSTANEMDASKAGETLDDIQNNDEILTDDETDEGTDDKEENVDETIKDDEHGVTLAGNETTSEINITSDATNEGNDQTGGILNESGDNAASREKAIEEETVEETEEEAKSESVQQEAEQPPVTPTDDEPNKISAFDDSSAAPTAENIDSVTKSSVPTSEPQKSPIPPTEDVRDETTKVKPPTTPDVDKESSGDTLEFASAGGSTHEQSVDSGSTGEKLDRTSVERISTDEELFEDAKSTLDSSGERKDKISIDETHGSGGATSADVQLEISPAIKEADLTASKTSTPTPSILIDTDDDAPIEVIKREGGRKRDYSRRRYDQNQSFDKSIDESVDDSTSAVSSRLRIKDRDRSESPYVDDELGEPSNKYKRRYSSTPIPDSLPNSPASSEDREREYRGWKKSIMLIYNTIHNHRFATMFAKPVNEDHVPNYRQIVYNPMDLQTLKRNIDTGITRSTVEFRRSIMFMCYNAIFYNMHDPVICARAKKMMADALEQIDEFDETWNREKEPERVPIASGSATKAIRGRKSNRLMN